MAPSKSKANHEDSKPETPNNKDKNGHPGTHQSNGKMRRVGSSAGSQLRDATSAASLPPVPPPPTTAAPEVVSPPSIQWNSFDRGVLHAYQRTYHLNTPTAFDSEYYGWVLGAPGSIGLHSPTMARQRELRRQSKDQLAGAARKHFNDLGVQENDVIVDFLHKVRNEGVTKPTRIKRSDRLGQDIERI